MICYNSNLLDGIKYEKKIDYEEIKSNEKIKNLSVFELYKIINKKIEEHKFLITTDKNNTTLVLFKENASNPNTDLQFILHKIYKHDNEYENILSHIIINLREENKSIKKEINEIKKILNNLCGKKEKQELDKEKDNKNEASNKNDDLPHTQKKCEAKTQIILRSRKLNNMNVNPNENIPEKKSKSPTHSNNDKDSNKTNKNLNPVKSSLTLSSLADLEYGMYPPVELSQNSFCKISGYGCNSYNGIVRNYNEDKTKVIIDYKMNKKITEPKGSIINPKISFFGLYDGHGGEKCSKFLQEKFDSFLFNSDHFPLYTLMAINEAYTKAEKEFLSVAYDEKNGKLLDQGGSCSLTVLIIDDWCFVSYLGDSRGLYSFDSGNQFYQITRDHKPNDPIEKERIEKAGGSVYKDDVFIKNGQKIHLKEENLPPIVSFAYRVIPGNLAVIYNL